MATQMERLLGDFQRRLRILERLPSAAPLSTPWAVHTPTYTNLSPGNAVVVSRYKRVGSQVHFYGEIRFGTATALNSNAFLISLPIKAHSAITTRIPLGVAMLTDSSAGLAVGGTARLASDTMLALQSATGGAVTATSPFTFTSTDSIGWNVIYEAAPQGA